MDKTKSKIQKTKSKCLEFSVWSLAVIMVFISMACYPKISDIENYVSDAKKGDRSAIKRLIKLLDYPDDDIRIKAYGGLIGAPNEHKKFIIDNVMETLKNTKTEGTKEFSIGLIGKMKAKEAVPVLIELSKDRGFKRRYVIYSALGEIQDETAVNSIIDAISDPLEDVRKYASRALIKTGPKAIPVIMERFKTAGEDVRGYLIRALGELRNNAPEDMLISQLTGSNKLDVIWALGKLGSNKSLPYLIKEAVNSDYMVRVAACQALGDLNQIDAIPVLKSAMNDKEVLVREWAARSIEVLTGERTLYRDEKGKLALPYNIYH